MACIRLAKLKTLALLVFVAVTFALVAGRGQVPVDRVVLLALAGGLASSGSAFLNHYFDRDLDALMPRTQNRPLPQGQIEPTRVYLLGLILVVSSLFLAWQLNHLVFLFVLSGMFAYVVVYTLYLKRRSSLNIVLGGAAGSCAALAGWFSAGPQ